MSESKYWDKRVFLTNQVRNNIDRAELFVLLWTLKGKDKHVYIAEFKLYTLNSPGYNNKLFPTAWD